MPPQLVNWLIDLPSLFWGFPYATLDRSFSSSFFAFPYVVISFLYHYQLYDWSINWLIILGGFPYAGFPYTYQLIDPSIDELACQFLVAFPTALGFPCAMGPPEILQWQLSKYLAFCNGLAQTIINISKQYKSYIVW